jgi:hypothetical protein
VPKAHARPFPLVLLALLVGCVTFPSRPETPGPGPGPAKGQTIHAQLVEADGGAPIYEATVTIQDGPNQGRTGTTNAFGQVFLDDLKAPAGQTVCGEKEGYEKACEGVTLVTSTNVTLRLVKVPPPKPVAKLAGRIRVEQGRFRNDAGWWQWLGISEFDLLHLAQTGRRWEVEQRLDNAAAHRLTNVRVLAMASIMFRLTPDDPGYGDSLTWLLEQAAARGLYIEFVFFADAQILYPRDADRERILRYLAGRVRAEHGVIPSLANEAFKNGWAEADDPKLLALADLAASILGHRDFIISDPQDGDNVDASLETMEKSVRIARHANIVALHSSRMGGSQPDGARLRRWVDHLEGFVDLLQYVSSAVKRQVAGVHNEPMGQASRCLDNRECDGEVSLAGALTALKAGAGYTYHRIAAHDPATPGLDLIGQIAPLLPPGPECQYQNDSIGDSATRGFTWRGKVRSWVCGSRGFVLAYGLDGTGSVTWANRWQPARVIYQSPDQEPGDLQRSKIAVYEVAR